MTEDCKLKAVADFPVPANITGLLVFLGLVNQPADFSPEVAKVADAL